jgi:hypothetical protein
MRIGLRVGRRRRVVVVLNCLNTAVVSVDDDCCGAG